MRKILFVLFFLPNLLWASDDQEKEFRLNQQIQFNQKSQEQQFIQQDNFLTTLRINNQEIVIGNNINEIMTALFLAINHKQLLDIKRLLEIYQQYPQAEQGMILFAKANIAFIEDDISKAIQYYEQLQQRAPDFTRGTLDLARLYYVDWRTTDAKNLFQTIHLADQPNVMARVNEFLTQIDRRQSWLGSFSFGAIYNSNLNQSGNEVSKEIINSPYWGLVEFTRSRPQVEKGYGLSYETVLNKYTAIRGHHGLIFKGLAYGEIYPKKSQFSEHNFSLGLGYRFKDRHNQLDIYPMFEKTYAYKHWYSQRQGIHFGYARNINPNWYLALQAEYKWERYQDSSLSHHNGRILSLYSTLAYNLPHDWILFGGLDYYSKFATDSKVDQYRRTGVRIGLSKSFDIGVDMSVQGIFRKTNYRQYNALLGKQRKDNEQKYLLTLAIPKWKIYGTTPSVQWIYTNHQSNAEMLYRYKQHEVAVKFEKSF